MHVVLPLCLSLTEKESTSVVEKEEKSQTEGNLPFFLALFSLSVAVVLLLLLQLPSLSLTPTPPNFLPTTTLPPLLHRLFCLNRYVHSLLPFASARASSSASAFASSFTVRRLSGYTHSPAHPHRRLPPPANARAFHQPPPADQNSRKSHALPSSIPTWLLAPDFAAASINIITSYPSPHR